MAAFFVLSRTMFAEGNPGGVVGLPDRVSPLVVDKVLATAVSLGAFRSTGGVI